MADDSTPKTAEPGEDGPLLDELAERFERFRILRNNDEDTDDARTIALVAIILTAIGWLIIPVTPAIVFWR